MFRSFPQAGIQMGRHGGRASAWVPAFAGTTGKGIRLRAFGICQPACAALSAATPSACCTVHSTSCGLNGL